ncbi:hypothetical protein CF319_g1203 [Tilletia indica]|nr:hypothetical protein CF319_g1203 [Tilletia indica]
MCRTSTRSSSADSPTKARLSGNTPSLSDRIAALQRRNVSGPASTSAAASTPTTALPPSSSSASSSPSGSYLAPPGGGGGGSSSASSAVKDRIARLQSKGDGESPLLPRSSFGAPAPNPEVASHALRQFPGASLGPAQGATLRPQMTGGAWLNGMPANTSGGPLRPQMTGGMWGNQYYGAHAAVPMPRRGVSPTVPTTPTRKQTEPVVLGGRDDAFAELDREAEQARAREESVETTTSDATVSQTLPDTTATKLPTFPSAPDSSPPPPSSATTSSISSAATTLPNLPEAPTEAPQLKLDPSPDDRRPPSPITANGQSREIEIGVRVPDDPDAQRKLDELVSAADNLHVQTTTPPSPTASSSKDDSNDPRKFNPLYRDITDDDDLLSPADQFGTLTVLRRSRTGSSVSDGLHGVGQAAVESLMDASDDDESQDREILTNSGGGGGGGKRNAISGLPPTSPPSRQHRARDEAGQNGTSHSDQSSYTNGSPARGSSSGVRTESPTAMLQSPIRGTNGRGGNGINPLSPSSSSSSSIRLPTSDSTESGMTVTSNPRTIHDSPDRVAELRRPSASGSSVITDRTQSPTIPHRSASVASSNYSSASGGRWSTAVPQADPIFEDSPSGSHGGRERERERDQNQERDGGGGSAASIGASAASPGSNHAAVSASAARARAREAIALARSKSQGGRLARPPPPGRTLTAAELDASDDDYEPGWASIISRK